MVGSNRCSWGWVESPLFRALVGICLRIARPFPLGGWEYAGSMNMLSLGVFASERETCTFGVCCLGKVQNFAYLGFFPLISCSAWVSLGSDAECIN